jgi:hypothetical protein
MWLGKQRDEELFVFLGRINIGYYFLFLWFILPFVGRLETYKK